MLLMLVILSSYDVMLMIFGRVSVRKFIIIKRKKNSSIKEICKKISTLILITFNIEYNKK